jgi:hypothetical protein
VKELEVAVADELSVTRTVTANDCAPVGFPEITPELELRVKPEGREPEAIEN